MGVQPLEIKSIHQLLVEISRQRLQRGWALIAMPFQGVLFQFTVGLAESQRHKELEVVGLDQPTGQDLLETLVAQVQAGQRLEAGMFFSSLLPGKDLFLVENPVDPSGPPTTQGRLRLIWPDEGHHYPWQPQCTPECARQALILGDEGLDAESLRLLMAHSEEIGRA